MEQLTQLIFRHAQPKRLNNTVITGPMLASLAEAYVEAINTGAVPTIATAWQVRQHIAAGRLGSLAALRLSRPQCGRPPSQG